MEKKTRTQVHSDALYAFKSRGFGQKTGLNPRAIDPEFSQRIEFYKKPLVISLTQSSKKVNGTPMTN